MQSRVLNRRLFYAFFLILSLLLILEALHFSGVIFNCTPSLPEGIYLRYEKAPFKNISVGDIVLIQKNEISGIEKGRITKVRRLLKKIIAKKGDFVTLQGNKVYINGNEAEGMEIFEKDALGKIKRSMQYPCSIPKGYYFVGSNCREGYDSRYWGLCPETAIKGKARMIYEFRHH